MRPQPLLGLSATRSKYVHHMPDGDQQGQGRADHQSAVRGRSALPTPTPRATIDSPRQMITNSRSAPRNATPPPAAGPAAARGSARPGPRSRLPAPTVHSSALPSRRNRPDDQQHHPDHHRDGEAGDRRPRRVARAARRRRRAPDAGSGPARRRPRTAAPRAEGLRHRQPDDEDQHRRRPAGTPRSVRESLVLGVGRPHERRPRPPHQRQDQHRLAEPRPARLVGQQRRHLGDREHEHQVPQQLDRAGPPLGRRSGGARDASLAQRQVSPRRARA